MPRTRWIVLGAALVLIAASLLGGRGSGGGRDLVWADGAMGARQGGADQYIVERWNQLHPMGPRVRIEPMPESPDDQHQQMAMALAAKSSDLDILTLDLVWTGEFAREHWLVDLKGIRPQIKAVSLTATVQSATWDNKLWAAPSTTDAGLLYYRKDLVGDLSGHEPKTWEELFELGLRVGREHGIAPFVGQGAPYEGMVVNYLEYLWSFGGDLFSADGTQVRFEDGPAIKAIELMRRGLHSGFYAPGFNAMKEEEARNAFQSGKAVFLRNWPYVYPLICE